MPPFLLGTRAIATLPLHAAGSIAAFSGLRVCPVPVELGRYAVLLLWRRTADNPWMRHVIHDAFRTALPDASP
ncbi:hypothetical protein [Komagataeibacter xylinus]|uniref:hypothetical protein n=1 Tax=Komagataeibacter xylinus TaxID=28448 RepID=UPI001F110BA4|nr:hypothetical protein [Komagataeibacter xylinus]